MKIDIEIEIRFRGVYCCLHCSQPRAVQRLGSLDCSCRLPSLVSVFCLSFALSVPSVVNVCICLLLVLYVQCVTYA